MVRLLILSLKRNILPFLKQFMIISRIYRMEQTQMKKTPSKYLKLFLSTFYLSAFTFGGGYVIVTLLKQKFVDELHWIDEEEMLDMVAIAQSSPGAIAVNGAIDRKSVV